MAACGSTAGAGMGEISASAIVVSLLGLANLWLVHRIMQAGRDYRNEKLAITGATFKWCVA
jgi:hypothetical protein